MNKLKMYLSAFVVVAVAGVTFAADFGPASYPAGGVPSASVNSSAMSVIGSVSTTGAASCRIDTLFGIVLQINNRITHAEAIVKLPNQSNLIYEFQFNGVPYAPTSAEALAGGKLRLNLDRSDIGHPGGTRALELRAKTTTSAHDFTYSASDPNQFVSVAASTACPS